MPLPEDFADECLYTPDQWYIHDILEWDEEAHRIVGLVDTTKLGALVEAQVAWPQHPKHFPGAVAVQLTGTLGNLHAVYMLGLRLSEGWVGFGTHIEKARFGSMGEIGPPVHAEMTVTRRRQFRGTWFLSYAFSFTQQGRQLYTSTQTAAWARPEVSPS